MTFLSHFFLISPLPTHPPQLQGCREGTCSSTGGFSGLSFSKRTLRWCSFFSREWVEGDVIVKATWNLSADHLETAAVNHRARAMTQTCVCLIHTSARGPVLMCQPSMDLSHIKIRRCESLPLENICEYRNFQVALPCRRFIVDKSLWLDRAQTHAAPSTSLCMNKHSHYPAPLALNIICKYSQQRLLLNAHR